MTDEILQEEIDEVLKQLELTMIEYQAMEEERKRGSSSINVMSGAIGMVLSSGATLPLMFGAGLPILLVLYYGMKKEDFQKDKILYLCEAYQKSIELWSRKHWDCADKIKCVPTTLNFEIMKGGIIETEQQAKRKKVRYALCIGVCVLSGVGLTATNFISPPTLIEASVYVALASIFQYSKKYLKEMEWETLGLQGEELKTSLSNLYDIIHYIPYSLIGICGGSLIRYRNMETISNQEMVISLLLFALTTLSVEGLLKHQDQMRKAKVMKKIKPYKDTE